MAPATDTSDAKALSVEWPFPVVAALGSAVRAAGIGRELRARLPWALRSCLTVDGERIVLGVPEAEATAFEAAAATVAAALDQIATLPVLPREIEDILTITAHERGKWLKDGRLKSAGTRTVKLRGRAKAVTFHVFDPRHVEDALDRDLPGLWREEDAQARAEKRRRSAAKSALTRAGGEAAAPRKTAERDKGTRSRLKGWDAFEIDGLLR